jgi:antitoxin ParD1/3/4/toxin ParE1/3/4
VNEYVISVEAELDLDEIWSYIAQDTIDAADRWIARLFDAFDVIARNPRIGHTRKDLSDDPVLFWPVDAYLVLYRVQVERVEIIAVTQGGRGIPSFVRQRTQ